MRTITITDHEFEILKAMKYREGWPQFDDEKECITHLYIKHMIEKKPPTVLYPDWQMFTDWSLSMYGEHILDLLRQQGRLD